MKVRIEKTIEKKIKKEKYTSTIIVVMNYVE